MRKRSDLKSEHDNLVNRAIAAFYRELSRSPGFIAGVSEVNRVLYKYSGVETVKRRQYVVLRDGNDEMMSVYRVKPDGILRRMRRPPAELVKS